MEVSDFQKQIVDFVRKWERKRGVSPSKDDVFIHLIEEVGELAAQYTNEKERKERYADAEVENAIGDMLMQLV